MKTTIKGIGTFGVLLSIACLFLGQATPASAQMSDRGYLLAQSDPDEAYDPFTDYSEFDEASDEEADINFFRNGRFFTVGLAGGYRSFTGNFGKAYTSGPLYGLYVTYFFDLRTAFTLGFLTGDHATQFETNLDTYSGTVSLTTLNFDFKYYFSTQSIKRSLADLSPYMILGFAQYYRTYSVAKIDGLTRDSTMGVDLGAGLEIPLMRRKSFLGIQACYHYVNFADENKDFITGSERLKSRLSGDMYDLLLILGMNF